MAVITLNIDDAFLPRAANALAWKGGYQATIPDPANSGQMMANPVTKNAFAKQQLSAYIRSATLDYETMQAQQALTLPASNLIS